MISFLQHSTAATTNWKSDPEGRPDSTGEKAAKGATKVTAKIVKILTKTGLKGPAAALLKEQLTGLLKASPWWATLSKIAASANCILIQVTHSLPHSPTTLSLISGTHSRNYTSVTLTHPLFKLCLTSEMAFFNAVFHSLMQRKCDHTHSRK